MIFISDGTNSNINKTNAATIKLQLKLVANKNMNYLIIAHLPLLGYHLIV